MGKISFPGYGHHIAGVSAAQMENPIIQVHFNRHDTVPLPYDFSVVFSPTPETCGDNLQPRLCSFHFFTPSKEFMGVLHDEHWFNVSGFSKQLLANSARGIRVGRLAPCLRVSAAQPPGHKMTLLTQNTDKIVNLDAGKFVGRH